MSGMSVIVPLALMLFVVLSLSPRRDGSIARRPYANQYTDSPGALDR